MKIRHFSCLFAVFFMLSSGIAAANSSISETKVSRIIVHDFGTAILVGLTSNVTNSEGCAINNQLVLAKSHPFFREAYSALLTAYSSGSTISGWVNGCDATFGGLKLTRLDLVK